MYKLQPMEHEPLATTESQVISLRLDQYDDIFSDFDIRPYSSRALSIDFLDEVKRAARDKQEGKIELILHLPKKKRNESHETKIKERLATHFKRHHHLLLQEKRHILRIGIRMILVGILCMLAATFVLFYNTRRNLLLSFIVVFLEPAAWFLVWEGMEQCLYNSKSTNPDLQFYRVMSNSSGHISFKSY